MRISWGEQDLTSESDHFALDYARIIPRRIDLHRNDSFPIDRVARLCNASVILLARQSVKVTAGSLVIHSPALES